MANTLTFANQTLTDADLYGGIDFIADLNTGEEFSIGNTGSASVKFKTYTQLPLYSKDSTNGTFTWTKDSTPRGRYYITEVTKEQSMYTVTAYDAMILSDVKIAALSLAFPLTVSAAASAIATYLGCTVSGTLVNGTLSVSSLDADLTVRQLLGYVAEASGCSIKIDGSDHLKLMYYADSGITVSASAYKSLEVADYTCAKIDNVTIFNMQGEIQATAGSGYNSLFIGQNPFLESATNTNATNILNKVKDFQYAPVKCEMFEENDVEVGTIATFGTTASLVMHVETSETGAIASSVGHDSRDEYNKSLIVVINETEAIAADAKSLATAASNILSDMQAAATAAGTTLNGIYADAESAKTTLAGMQAAAIAANTTLNGIYQDAADAAAAASAAQTSADNAGEYAARALGNLSTVQSVTETLNWITAHGTMTLTSDVALDPTHVYFVREAGGDYHVGAYYYNVVTDPDVADIGTYYELTIDESLNNYVGTHLAVDGEGLWLIPETLNGNRVLIATGSGSAYPIAGTYIVGSVGEVIARFTATEATIGIGGDSSLIMGTEGITGFGESGVELFNFSTSGISLNTRCYERFLPSGLPMSEFPYTDADGYGITLGDTPTSSIKVELTYMWGVSFEINFTYGTAETKTSSGISVDGQTITLSATYDGDKTFSKIKFNQHSTSTHLLGGGMVSYSVTKDTPSFKIGGNLTASGGYSYAEGYNATASGNYSHAEGHSTTATNKYAHAEGFSADATGEASHAEGYNTQAAGAEAHAEGYYSEANGVYSHAQNMHTVADKNGQTAIGTYNVPDTTASPAVHPNGNGAYGHYALIIGNGTSSSAQSNALAVTWDGNIEMDLPGYQTAGTTDKAIYDAIVALGWDSDVLIP